MRLVFLGSGAFGVPTLERLIAEHEVVGVVTQPARRAGRGRKVTPTPIAERAEAAGLPVWAVENVNEPAFVEQMLATGARLGVVVAFGQKIGPAILSGLPGGCVNLHASLLPKYRGAAPIQWAIIKGERRTGVTVFKLVKRMDAGDVLSVRATEIADDETYGGLHDRLAALGPNAVLEAVAKFEATTDPAAEPQDEAAATKAPKLTKADGALNFAVNARELSCRIRGTWPWPGGVCRFGAADGSREEDVTIACAVATAADDANATQSGDRAPGTVLSDMTVAAGAGAIAIREIKPAGGRLMAWQDYVNGRRIRAGDRFISL